MFLESKSHVMPFLFHVSRVSVIYYIASAPFDYSTISLDDIIPYLLSIPYSIFTRFYSVSSPCLLSMCSHRCSSMLYIMTYMFPLIPPMFMHGVSTVAGALGLYSH